MAWGEVKVVEQRKLFIAAYLEEKYKIAELCRQFDISRPTAYKWLERYKNEGEKGLLDHSKAPLHQPGETPQKIIQKILQIRHQFSEWGPRKILGHLKVNNPMENWPSATTIGNILTKNGLTVRRKYRRRIPARTEPLMHCKELNDIWTIDFKGWFLTKDGHKCDPFTLVDAHSRYLLRCLKLRLNDTAHVWAVLEAAFREYGLPHYIRSDNGPPFATTNAGRISPLSVKLIKAGVIPEWIEPGKPQQNGRHERMHLTLKNEGVFPGILSLEEQQIKFKEFQHYYNFIRPHEALGQVPPGNIYQPSCREWNGRLRSPEYSDFSKVCKVKSCGKMSWKGGEVYISRTLENEPVGLKETETGEYTIYYGPIILGVLTNKNEFIIERRKPRRQYQRSRKSKEF